MPKPQSNDFDDDDIEDLLESFDSDFKTQKKLPVEESKRSAAAASLGKKGKGWRRSFALSIFY